MGRAPCCEKVGLKRGRWTAEEDEILINYIKKNGEGSWRSLPKKAGLLRCGKSCRLRWINYLRADLKRGNFSLEEEQTIMKLHSSVGNRWSLIASHLPGRTDNEVKNYWNSHLSRKIFSLKSNNGNNLITSIDLLKITNTQKRRGGGRVSRSVAKKYNKSTTTTTTTTATARMLIQQNSTTREEQQLTTSTENVKVIVAADDTREHDREKDYDLRRRADDDAKNMGGPFEEPDQDVAAAALLDQFFLNELSDLCKITINTTTSSYEEKVNGPMAAETSCRLVVNGDDGNSEAWQSISSSSSNAESGLLQACFSPFNFHFEDIVMAKLDMSDSSMGFGLWD